MCSRGLSPNSESSTNTSQFCPSLVPPRQLLGELYALNRPTWPPPSTASIAPPSRNPPPVSRCVTCQWWWIEGVCMRGCHRRHRWMVAGLKCFLRRSGRHTQGERQWTVFLFYNHSFHVFCWHTFTSTDISKSSLTGKSLWCVTTRWKGADWGVTETYSQDLEMGPWQNRIRRIFIALRFL